MTKFDLGFNPFSVSPIETLEGKKELIPPAVYLAKVTGALRRPTKQCPDCWYWLLTFSIIGGEFEGRSLPARFNIVNTNDEAQEIGRSQFRHYLDCIGCLNPKSEAELRDVPVLITVGTRKGSFKKRNGEEVPTAMSVIERIDPFVDPSDQCAGGSCPVPPRQDEPVPY